LTKTNSLHYTGAMNEINDYEDKETEEIQDDERFQYQVQETR